MQRYFYAFEFHGKKTTPSADDNLIYFILYTVQTYIVWTWTYHRLFISLYYTRTVKSPFAHLHLFCASVAIILHYYLCSACSCCRSVIIKQCSIEYRTIETCRFTFTGIRAIDCRMVSRSFRSRSRRGNDIPIGILSYYLLQGEGQRLTDPLCEKCLSSDYNSYLSFMPSDDRDLLVMICMDLFYYLIL